ncbi:MAG: dihydroorotase [Alphaproteobacteria bacterium]|nr:dihydroorotase [Alphaproteobacteria bacterium]
MARGRIAYLNARLLDPASGLDAPGALLVDDGKIADFGPHLFRDGAPSVREVVDCQGHCLAPGLVDMRVHLREPGEEYLESIDGLGDAALAGGVTEAACLPNTHPPIDDVPVVEFIARRAREAKKVKLTCYGALTRGLAGTEITEIGLLQQAGAIAFTDGDKATANAKLLARAMKYAASFDAMIVQHPEEPSLAEGGLVNRGELASRLGLSAIPPEAEVIMVERDLRLAAMSDARLHFAHVTTAPAIAAIAEARARGQRVTCDTAPHYFALNETAIGDYRTYAKVSPPLRSEEDRRAVVQGLAEGVIDAVASDHAPHDQDSKRLPFAQASFGVIGVETLLPLTLELYHNRHLSLLEALALVTERPASLLRLPAGRLKKGAPADLVIFDPDKPWRIQEENLASQAKNTAFDLRPVQGHALLTVVDGRRVYCAPDGPFA